MRRLLRFIISKLEGPDLSEARRRELAEWEEDYALLPPFVPPVVLLIKQLDSKRRVIDVRAVGRFPDATAATGYALALDDEDWAVLPLAPVDPAVVFLPDANKMDELMDEFQYTYPDRLPLFILLGLDRDEKGRVSAVEVTGEFWSVEDAEIYGAAVAVPGREYQAKPLSAPAQTLSKT